MTILTLLHLFELHNTELYIVGEGEKMETIEINTATIQLDQLLKWAGIVETGGQVKLMLDDQLIKLNGDIVTERRKKIHPGDVIEIDGLGKWQISSE